MSRKILNDIKISVTPRFKYASGGDWSMLGRKIAAAWTREPIRQQSAPPTTCWIGMDLSPNSPGISCYNANNRTLSLIYLDQAWTRLTPQATRLKEYKPNCALEMVPGSTVDRIVFYAVASEPREEKKNASKKRKRENIEKKTSKKQKRDLNVETERLIHETVRLFAAIDLCTHGVTPDSIRVLIEDYTPKNAASARKDMIHHEGGAMRMELARRGIRFDVVSNMTVKAKFGGHGKADKHDMWRACARQYPAIIAAIESQFDFSHKTFSQKYEAKFKQKHDAWMTAMAVYTTELEAACARSTTAKEKAYAAAAAAADEDDDDDARMMSLLESEFELNGSETEFANALSQPPPEEPVLEMGKLKNPLSDLVDSIGMLNQLMSS